MVRCWAWKDRIRIGWCCRKRCRRGLRTARERFVRKCRALLACLRTNFVNASIIAFVHRNPMDKVSSAKRSAMMSGIRSKNTRPEIKVRSLLHQFGYRFRIHRRDLPGNPDIVMPKYRRIIFVQGCFWHAHNCSIAKLPKTRLDYWLPKFERTKARDQIAIKALRERGWKILELWECEVRAEDELAQKVVRFMTSSNPQSRRAS